MATDTKPKPAGLGVRMVLGALGGMGAACVCHPLDVIRVQMQIDGVSGGARAYSGPLDAASKIYARKGIVAGLYPGIDAAFLRQWTYGACRVGIYAFLLDKAQQGKEKGTAIPFSQKLLMGSTAGAIGSFVGVPAELALVRMSADSKLPPAEQRHYRHVGDCIMRTAREEGATALWKGGTPTIIRATLLSSAVLGCYSEVKEQLHTKLPTVFPDKNGIPLMFTGTVFASFVANGVSNPFDVVKSRVQNMPRPQPGQQPQYAGMADCFVKSVKGEGPMVLMRGFVPAFLKLAPYTTISLILTDNLARTLGYSTM